MQNEVLNENIYGFLGVECAELKRLLDFLIKSEDCLKEFLEEYYTGDIYESVIAYQKYKKHLHRMDRQKFDNAIAQGDIKDVFERLFQEPLEQKDIDRIYELNLTYSEIFNRYEQFSQESFNNIVKNNLIKINQVDDSFLVE